MIIAPSANKFTLRSEQQSALDWFSMFLEGDQKYALMELPTGTGKSLLSMHMADKTQEYKRSILQNEKYQSSTRIITSTKQLQRQYVREFEEIASVWGKENYTCHSHGTNCAEGKIISSALKKESCQDCPAKKEYEEWKTSQLSVTNAHLMAGYVLYVSDLFTRGTEIKSKGSIPAGDLLIIDEAHLLESSFIQYISCVLDETVFSRLDIHNKNYRNHLLLHSQDLFSFAECIKKELMPYIQSKIQSAESDIANHNWKTEQDKVKLSKIIDTFDKYMCRFNRFLNDSKNWEWNWVFEKSSTSAQSHPIFAGPFIRNSLFSLYDKVVLMSGTILDPLTFSRLTGASVERSSFYKGESSFPVKNRPVVYAPVGKMSFAHRQMTEPKLIETITKIIELHPDKKGIIHTHSFSILKLIKEHFSENPRFIFDENAQSRDISIKKHIMSTDSSIIVSPSLTTGIDLPGDLNRFQIICKIPYPDLKSEVTQRKFKQFNSWYFWATSASLIQTYGRGVRSNDDWCITYILDQSLEHLLRRGRRFVNKYFLDALKF